MPLPSVDSAAGGLHAELTSARTLLGWPSDSVASSEITTKKMTVIGMMMTRFFLVAAAVSNHNCRRTAVTKPKMQQGLSNQFSCNQITATTTKHKHNTELEWVVQKYSITKELFFVHGPSHLAVHLLGQ